MYVCVTPLHSNDALLPPPPSPTAPDFDFFFSAGPAAEHQLLRLHRLLKKPALLKALLRAENYRIPVVLCEALRTNGASHRPATWIEIIDGLGPGGGGGGATGGR